MGRKLSFTLAIVVRSLPTILATWSRASPAEPSGKFPGCLSVRSPCRSFASARSAGLSVPAARSASQAGECAGPSVAALQAARAGRRWGRRVRVSKIRRPWLNPASRGERADLSLPLGSISARLSSHAGCPCAGPAAPPAIIPHRSVFRTHTNPIPEALS